MYKNKKIFVLVAISILAIYCLSVSKFENFVAKYIDVSSIAKLSFSQSIEEQEQKSYEVTMVTLYIPLGDFQKGGPGNIFTNSKYYGWMETFGWLTNKLVAFIEGDEYYNYLKEIRAKQPADRTVLIKINRMDLPSFKDYDKVADIYSSPMYPKHHPNTVNANYSLTMNAKYDALQMAMDLGHVDTKYLAWMDIGYFRNLQKAGRRPKNDSFTLQIPLDFDEKKIGFSLVGNRENLKNLSPWDYIRGNHVWVAGGFILGTRQIIQKFITSYKQTFETLLDRFMSSTDQQVIGAMYSPQFIKNQEVVIQSYSCSNGKFGLYYADSQYFCLGYICLEAASLRMNSSLV